ncbi:MAG: RNA polymerase factor sigma-54 [Bradymonadaceae bacterium]|nr:RNA polymerase factor sigma-54 [Lujinxingiaceae bacterium]
MAMELRQQVKMAQTLRMTPQLQHAIKLLQLSRMELIAEVRQEMVENPVLEELPESYESDPLPSQDFDQGERRVTNEKVGEVKADGSDIDKVDWEAYVDNYSSSAPSNSYKGLNHDEYPSLEQTLSTSVSLVDHLMTQLRLTALSQADEHIGTLIIGNLDEAGLLSGSTIDEIAHDAGADLEAVERVLAVVQEFDPVGVAARNLGECLRIQARKLYPHEPLLRILIDEHIPNLERKSYNKIARELGIDVEKVVAAARLLSTLEPRPGREYQTAEPRYITPDIYIHKVGDEYVPVLNEDGMPKLKISNFYRKELARKKASGEKDEVKEYIQEKLRGAMWLIRSIHNRQSTIVKVTESIIKFQRDFFDKGVEHLRPLVLRDVAEDIEMSESTVSRVTTNKYVHTPRGIFELKFFFNSSITNLEGEDLASEAVKAKIREIITKENDRRPFSDSKIVEMLAADNIDIARRTVAKYRESMGILSSAKRKQMF